MALLSILLKEWQTTLQQNAILTMKVIEFGNLLLLNQNMIVI